jgi:hypothetical protein
MVQARVSFDRVLAQLRGGASLKSSKVAHEIYEDSSFQLAGSPTRAADFLALALAMWNVGVLPSLFARDLLDLIGEE